MKPCSRCGAAMDRGAQRWCCACHAAYMREWRKTHRLSPEQRRKANCRRHANVYVERGKLKPAPCERCGEARTEKHHEDYSQPLAVRWLCRPCHMRPCHMLEHDGRSFT